MPAAIVLDACMMPSNFIGYMSHHRDTSHGVKESAVALDTAPMRSTMFPYQGARGRDGHSVHAAQVNRRARRTALRRAGRAGGATVRGSIRCGVCSQCGECGVLAATFATASIDDMCSTSRVETSPIMLKNLLQRSTCN